MSCLRSYYRPAMKQRIMRGEEPAWITNHNRCRYIRASILSFPPWVDRAELKMIEAWAKAMTVFTGVLHVVDHVIPLGHPYVSGLSVPWNLRVVPWRVNASKGGQWHPDQLPLFSSGLDKDFEVAEN